MGKGDRKTAKGKRYNSSYGNARKATSKTTGAASAPVAKKATRTTKTVTKAPAKKAAAKKVVAKG